MAELELKAVEKTYDRVRALWPTDLLVEAGEFLVLLGPSGCGKTTLLRMIAGLEEITGGDLLIGGRRVNDLKARDRNIAMVFQSYALYPHLTVAENLGFPLKIKGLPKDEVAGRVARVAEVLGLSPLLQRKPGQLSGGQRQRVAVGRAMVREPALFLFDEPLSNLDAALREEMRSELIALHRRLGKTIVYVTHDQTEAMALATRLVVMKDGRIQQVGKPREIYERPANTFVATFIGSPRMNLLPLQSLLAMKSRSGGAATAALGGFGDAEDTLVGFRAEDVTLAPQGSEPLLFEARVVSSQMLGATTLLDCLVEGHRLQAQVSGSSQVPAEGSLLSIGVRHASALHVFAGPGGARLSTPPARHVPDRPTL